MLLPREKALLSGLNSYYLDSARFVEHLQGELSSGCVAYHAPQNKMAVFFDQDEVIRVVVRDADDKLVDSSPSLLPLLDTLKKGNFLVSAHYINEDAIYFWSSMPEYRFLPQTFNSKQVPIEVIIQKLQTEKFSGFLDVSIGGTAKGCTLFFIKGNRMGGSYSWGRGGMDNSEQKFKDLTGRIKFQASEFKMGRFLDS